MDARERLQLRAIGVVQGVGFRPFVHRLAHALDLAGFVRNDLDGVWIEVEGSHAALLEFLARMPREKPRAAILYSLDPRWLPATGAEGFEIRPSRVGGSEARAWLLPDLSICADCTQELLDPADRRHRYPFLNCTHCGPRYTILESLPYDRARTSMQHFELCPSCRNEYEDPQNRRFHAQPTACARCGPRLRFVGVDGVVAEEGDAALRRAEALLRDGRILALKGLGGYHVLVDATDEPAVARLRARKGRPTKALAVLVRDVCTARRWVEIPAAAAALLEGAAGPIVLLRRTKAGQGEIAPSVAPGCDALGVFLPTTPLHRLLVEDLEARPLVCTSGNPSDQPTICDDDEALAALSPIVDGFLVHDRPILRAVDDSVVQWLERPRPRPQLLRRARGYAPLPLLAPHPLPPALALGGHMNVTVAVARDREIVLSPHLGEMESTGARESLERSVRDLLGLLDVQPVWIAHDLHPDYFTTALAAELAAEWDIARHPVQHHHAHFAAALLERESEGPALGVIFDGTGYGPDGTVWGGELLQGTAARSERIGSLQPFVLVGGEAAVREPWRCALALLDAAFEGQVPEDLPCTTAAPESTVDAVRQLLRSQRATVRTTSAGRLFDGFAALLGLCFRNTHQAEAPQCLEWAARAAKTPAESLPFAIRSDEGFSSLDWRPAVRAAVERWRQGEDAGSLAAAFHRGLAAGVLEWVQSVAPAEEVFLGGGVFCNRLLTETLLVAAREQGERWCVPTQLPPTDGALAAGQLWSVAVRERG